MRGASGVTGHRKLCQRGLLVFEKQTDRTPSGLGKERSIGVVVAQSNKPGTKFTVGARWGA